MKAAILARRPDPAIAKALVDGRLSSQPFINLVSKAPIEWSRKFRKLYQWDRPLAREVFGKPDALFRGEWQYALYLFEAIVGTKRQQFVLWSDPRKAGKGSTIELLEPCHPETVFPIIKALHNLHP